MFPARPIASAVAIIAAVGLVGQAALTIGLLAQRGDGVGAALLRLSGFFTIWTNLAVAGVAVAVALGAIRGPAVAVARVAVLPSILTVGILFTVLLRPSLGESSLAQSLVSSILHDVSPVGFLLLWLAGPHERLRWRAAAAALVLPAAYITYSFARSLATGSYPYWFLDPSAIGVAAYARNVVLLAGGFAAMGLLLVAAGRRLAAHPE